MASDQYISVRESAQVLGVTEKTIMDMIEKKDLQAYRIANQFLRLKRSEILNLRKTGTVETETTVLPYSRAERLRDFFYYNDFYIVSCLLIAALALVIWQT